MIPTLIVLGLALGRWWRSTLVVGLVGWPLLLLADHLLADFTEAAEAAGLALLNIGAGVLVHQALLAFYRWWRRRDQAAADRPPSVEEPAAVGSAGGGQPEGTRLDAREDL